MVGLGGLEPPTSPLSGAFGRGLGESGSHPRCTGALHETRRLDGRGLDCSTEVIDPPTIHKAA